jgi:hypothetical protein
MGIVLMINMSLHDSMISIHRCDDWSCKIQEVSHQPCKGKLYVLGISQFPDDSFLLEGGM